MPTMISPDTLQKKTRRVVGQHTTVAAEDAVTFAGISVITGAIVCMATDPTDDLVSVSCTISGGTLTIKTWKNTSGSDPTPAAASSFSKVINYLVEGY